MSDLIKVDKDAMLQTAREHKSVSEALKASYSQVTKATHEAHSWEGHMADATRKSLDHISVRLGEFDKWYLRAALLHEQVVEKFTEADEKAAAGISADWGAATGREGAASGGSGFGGGGGGGGGR